MKRRFSLSQLIGNIIMLKNNNKTLLFSAISVLMLSACGGGSDSEKPAPQTPPPTAVNAAPVITSTNFETKEDNQLTAALSASDVENDSITFSLVSEPTNGELTLNSDGSFVYTGNQNYFGNDSFSVKANDGSSDSTTQSLAIVISAVNDEPIVTASNFAVDEDNQLTAALSASDVENDSLTFSLVSEPTNGELTLNSDGSFVYTGNQNYFGNDSFSVKANDGTLDSPVQTLSINVSAVNDAPVAADNVAISTRRDLPVTINLLAQDIDNTELVYQVSTQPASGVIGIEGSDVTYTPNSGAEGADSFTVSVSDGEANASTEVTVINDLSYSGTVISDDMNGVQVLLTAGNDLHTTTPDQNGDFKFYGVDADQFSVKVRKSGYRSSPSKMINLETNQSSSVPKPIAKFSAQQQSSYEDSAFELTKIEGDNFIYHWEEDQTTAGTDYSASVNQPVEVEFLDETLTIIDDSSADKLRQDYNILLVDTEESAWDQEQAFRILETMKTIPQEVRDPYETQSLLSSKWMITSDFLQDDIQINESLGQKTVLISSAVFTNATPRVALVEGKRGIYYSNKLHHALVRYVTDNGTNKKAYERILNERYGVTTVIKSYPTLTARTTNEGRGRFQAFQAEEIVRIINMFEEMPSGFHALPELKYLVRRLNGTPHPLYPTAPAVAWPSIGYIEFMETAFTSSSVEHLHRLIIHEKAHFLWANQFDEQLKDDWIELGGWSENEGVWTTTKQTEFVSAYAHSENPNEDMAESVSYFMVNPDALRSRALAKYEFVRDRIMQGNIYLSTIREDLTFQVYNLFPDYVFPGKIKRVDIEVVGADDADKTVYIELELHALDAQEEGASRAFTRIHSEIGTYKDLHFYPVDDNGNRLGNGAVGTTLKGSFSLDKRAKAGYWRPRQIQIVDAVGNRRLEGANDFGWKLYVNNKEEDQIAPSYVSNTAQLTKSITNRESQEVQIIHASWQVDENADMKARQACYASLNDEIDTTYRVEAHGEYRSSTESCNVNFVMPHYMPSSNYTMNFVKMEDAALNTRGVYFTNPGHGLGEEEQVIDEQPQQIQLITNNQDLEAPELDLNHISVVATAMKPEEPNGETEVKITFRVRDNISGYNIASIILRDPQGTDHQYWAYNDSTHKLFPESDPTQYQEFTRTIILPLGSAPGTWGISEMTVYDRAGNFKFNDFTEIVHFDVTD